MVEVYSQDSRLDGINTLMEKMCGEVEVPTEFLITQGISAHREGRYTAGLIGGEESRKCSQVFSA